MKYIPILIKENFGIVLLLVVSIFSVLPFLNSGFIPMHDDTQVGRIFEMGKALSEGQFPVRWVEDLGYGYGYPIFNFYAPLPYYIGGFLTVLGFDTLTATKSVFVLGIVLSAATMYVFMRSFFSTLASFTAASLYLYFPYHAVNIFVRGALGELYAYAFLPLVFLGFYKIHYEHANRDKSFKWIFLSGIIFACVALSHNLSFFMLSLFLALFILISLVVSKNKITLLIFYAVSVVLGLLLSSFYILPAALEVQYTNVSSQIGGGADYKDHFVCVSQFWESIWGYGGSVKGCLDGMSFRLGKLQIIFSILSLVCLIVLFIRKKRKFLFFSISTILFLAVAIKMSLSVSESIWNSIPFMEYLQYPWRFLNFAGLFSSILIALPFYYIADEFKKHKKYILLVAVCVVAGIIAINVRLFTPQQILDRDSVSYTNAEYLRWVTSKISDEYLPKNFEKPFSEQDVPKKTFEVLKEKGVIESEERKTTMSQAKVRMNEQGIVRVNIAYFPGWSAYLNGEKTTYATAENKESDSTDGMYLSLPKGIHEIEFKLSQTPIEKLSNFFSLIGVFACISGIIMYRKRYHGTKKTS